MERSHPTNLKQRAADAADDLIAAADYLKTALERGDGILESHWLDPLMRVHEVLEEISAQPDD